MGAQLAVSQCAGAGLLARLGCGKLESLEIAQREEEG